MRKLGSSDPDIIVASLKYEDASPRGSKKVKNQ